MKRLAISAFAVAFILTGLAFAKRYTLFEAVVLDDAASRDQAVAALREIGPKGLNNLLDTYRADIDRHMRGEQVEHWDRISAAIDAVAQQKDAHASGLYWYTDLEKAKAAARELNRPILSLRLLGTLDAEFSCANSRFFRTVLYANADVSKYLRENYVLHWQSVRPVPRITIDFGDGRKIERTITGNSIHYVLDENGAPIDGIPGLYGPAPFLSRVQDAANIFARVADANDPERRSMLRQWHERRIAAIDAQWNEDLARIGQSEVAAPGNTAQKSKIAPTARDANRLSIAKSRAETAPLRQVVSNVRSATGEADDDMWAQLAALHGEGARLDDSSRALIARKQPAAQAATRLTRSKAFVEDPMLRLVRTFERSIAEDTVRNEYQLHRRIHEWFAQGAVANLDSLNERVYAELFLTPSSDPWLGLLQEDTYTALEDGGAVVRK